MPQIVKVGQVEHEFPDDMDDAQISAALDAEYSKPAAAPVADAPAGPGLMQRFKDFARRGYEVNERLPGNIVKSVKAQAGEMAGGVKQFFADKSSANFGEAAERLRAGKPVLGRRVPGTTPEQQAQAYQDVAFSADMASSRGARQAGEAAIAGEDAIPADAGFLERAAQQGVASAAISAPAVMLTGPVGGAALLGLGSGGSRYAELVRQGVPRETAQQSAAFMGSLEGLTEYLPGKTLVKNVPGFWNHLAEFLVTELPGENITSVAQLVDDYRLGLRDDITKDDILNTLAETSAATAFGSGAQIGAAKLLETTLQRLSGVQPEQTAANFQMPEPVFKADAPQLEYRPEIDSPDFVAGGNGGEVRRPGEAQAALPLKPEPSTGQVEVGSDGAARPLSRADVNAADVAREGWEAGQADRDALRNITRVPLEAAASRTATPEQTAQLQQAGLAGPNGTLLPAGRRVLQRRRVEEIKAKAAEVPEAPIAAFKSGDNWTVTVDGAGVVTTETEAVAHDLVRQAKSEAQPATVLGQQIEHPAQPTQAQAEAGNYRKPVVRWNDMTIRVENVKGSERSGKDSSGKAWSRKLTSDYGYVSKTTAKDGDAVDVYMGDTPDQEMVYVVDQLTPDGTAYDEMKAIVAVPSQKAAEQLYLSNYPKGWKGMGAITPMQASKFRKLVMEGDATKPLAWKPAANESRRQDSTEKDTNRVAAPAPTLGARQDSKQKDTKRVAPAANQDRRIREIMDAAPNGVTERDVTKALGIDPNSDEGDAWVQAYERIAAGKDYVGEFFPGRGIVHRRKGVGVLATKQERPKEQPTMAKGKPSLVERMKKAVTPAAPKVDPLYTRHSERLTAIANEAGWSEIGGKMIRASEDVNSPDYAKVTGRTKWIARNDLWQQAQQAAPLSGNKEGMATRSAVRRAIAGEKLNAAETRHVRQLIDVIVHEQMEADRLAEMEDSEAEAALAARIAELEERLKDAQSIHPEGTTKIETVGDEIPFMRRFAPGKEPVLPLFSRSKGPSGDLFSGNIPPAPADQRRVNSQQVDLFGDPVAIKNEIQRLKAELAKRQERRNVPLETGNRFDLFSQARQQEEIPTPKQPPKGEPDVQRAVRDPEPDRTKRADADDVGAAPVQPQRTGEAGGTGEAVEAADRQRDVAASRERLPATGTAAGRKQSDLTFHNQAGLFGSEIDAPRGDVNRGSAADIGIGQPNDELRADQVGDVVEAARPSVNREQKRAQQRAAEPIEVLNADADNIAATLPFLLPSQHEDVLTAERRFREPTGYGMLFTNGTGTGKTFVGLGIIKRLVKRGKGRVLIAVPSQKIADDWILAGAELGLGIYKLEDLQDKGRGVSITTHANMGENQTLADDEWDHVLIDEAHGLMQGAQAEPTAMLHALRVLTYHPASARDRAAMLNRTLYNELETLAAKIKKDGKWASMADRDRREVLNTRFEEKVQEQRAVVASKKGFDRPRATFLTATPFAYEKNVQWGEGYLFEYDRSKDEGRGYNDPDSYAHFMITHFGYRMRTGKLTEPDANVNRDLMQRTFNTWLRKQGALSARMLEVDADYDRKFVYVESKIGSAIDEGLNWLRASENRRMWPIHDAIKKRFDFLERSRLLQALKAREAIPYIKKQHALGRKVVVFYDYNEGGSFNVFDIDPESVGDSTVVVQGQQSVKLKDLVNEFRAARPDLVSLQTAAFNPLITLAEAFPQMKQYNGNISTKNRNKFVREFNDDEMPDSNLIMAQKAANAGWSAHDTTGIHQRVLINLGLPTAPVTAIQQEGRIYRVGQVSDAVFRYFNTGTNWERWAFASTIAHRAGTAENLAMGEQARGLKDAFITAFEAADIEEPGPGDGRGGKVADRAIVNALSDFDKAKGLYYAQQKKTSRTKAAEGADYFATPEPLGQKMVEWLGLRAGEKSLEPSAGHGAIARWLPDNTPRMLVEQSQELASRLALVTDAKIHVVRFEAVSKVNKFHGVVMNPPFGTGGRTAIDHVAHAAEMLYDGGRLVALIPEGPSANAKFDKWYEAQEDMHLMRSLSLPAVTFERAGTSVKTRIVIMDRVTKKAQKEGARMAYQGSAIDISADTINELFDRIENLDAPDRAEIVDKEAQAAAEAAARVQEADDKRAAELSKAIEDRRNATLARAGAVAATTPAGKFGAFKTAQTKHTKTGVPLYVAMAENYLSGDQYKAVNAVAKRHGGYWSSFRGAGAIPGFQFLKEESRASFLRDMGIEAPKLLRSKSPVTGLFEKEVRSQINAALRSFANRPYLSVVQDYNDLPLARRRRLEELRGSERGDLKAFFDEGTIYFIANEFSSPDQVTEALLHEYVTHFGLSMLPDDVRHQILDGIAAANPEVIEQMGAQEFGEEWNRENVGQRRLAAEEALAYTGQKYLNGETISDKLKRWVDYFIAQVRDLFRYAGGLGPKFDKVFIKRLLQDLQTHLKSGEARGFLDRSTDGVFTDPAMPYMQRETPVYYSALERAAVSAKREKGTAQEWLSTLRNIPGVKQEEMDWVGLEPWITGLDHRASKPEVIDFIRANQIKVEETVKGGGQSENLAMQERARIIVELSAIGWSYTNNEPGEPPYLQDRNENVWMHWDGEWQPSNDENAATIPPNVEEMAARAAEIDEIAAVEGDDGDETKYSRYTLPGGENYRELLLTLPARQFDDEEVRRLQDQLRAADGEMVSSKHGSEAWQAASDRAGKLRKQLFEMTGDSYGEQKRASGAKGRPDEYRSAHWTENNILAHLRFNERTDADGKRVLFVEEIQSDWHQAGRKRGYKGDEAALRARMKELEKQRAAADRDSGEWHAIDVELGGVKRQIDLGVPDAPFKTSWPELAFKRMIRWAAENGFDRIAWAPGKVHADRYSLRKQVKAIYHRKHGDVYQFTYTTHNGQENTLDLQQDEIGTHFGEELAQRIINGEGEPTKNGWRVLSGLDLEVGGEGMIGFYDDILPKTVNKLVKKWGARVSSTSVDTGKNLLKAKELSAKDLKTAVREYMRGNMTAEEFHSEIGMDGIVDDEADDFGSLESGHDDLGAAVAEIRRRIEQRRGGQTVHSVDVTPDMREAAMQGLPLFQRSPQANQAAPLFQPVNRLRPQHQQRGYKAMAEKAVNAWNEAIGWRWSPLGKLPQENAYLKLRYATLGKLDEVKGITRGIFDSLKAATPADAKAVYDYLTTFGASSDDILDTKIRIKAEEVKMLIDEQGQALVDVGLLPQESYDEYAGQYLPRLYLKHIMGDDVYRAMGTNMKTTDLGYLKKRKDIPEEVRKVILGQIYDPSFLAAFGVSRTMRDLAMIDFMESVSENAAWVPAKMLVTWNGKKVSPYWLQKEAARVRRQADFLKDTSVAARARTVADGMDTLANTALNALSGANLEDFKQMPDTPRYGMLRGMWVRKEIYEDMVSATQFIEPGSFEAFFQRTTGKLTRYWKTAKVGVNVPSHLRNMMGNTIQLQLSGVPFHKMPMLFAHAISSITSDDRYYQIAKRYGLRQSTFANTELSRIRDEFILLAESKSGDINRMQAVFSKMTQAIGDVYQMEESLFKLAKLRYEMEENGLSEADAMIEAHKWLFDYSLVPRWIRYARNAPLGSPFATYFYKVLPRMAEVAVKQPWKYLPYIAGYYALKGIIMAAWDVPDDELDKLKAAMPSWMRSSGGMMLLPWKDQHGRWQALNVGYIMPWGSLFDAGAQIGEGEFTKAVTTVTGVMSGPVPDMISAFQTGKDSFTGKDIINKNLPPFDQNMQRLNYVLDMALPGWLSPSGWAGKMKDLLRDKVDPRTGDPKLTGAQTWARLMGLTIYPVDAEETRKTNIYFMQKDIENINRERSKASRDKSLSEEEKADARRALKEYADQKKLELDDYKRESRFDRKLNDDPADKVKRVIEKIEGLVQGAQDKPDAAARVREAGYPAFAGLLDDLPATPRASVRKALQESSA